MPLPQDAAGMMGLGRADTVAKLQAIRKDAKLARAILVRQAGRLYGVPNVGGGLDDEILAGGDVTINRTLPWLIGLIAVIALAAACVLIAWIIANRPQQPQESAPTLTPGSSDIGITAGPVPDWVNQLKGQAPSK